MALVDSALKTQKEPLGRVAQRRERTRAALLEAAEWLSGERGLDAVSIDEIVMRADVAKGTFYNHFADKEDLARVIAAETRARIEDEIGHLNNGVSDPALRMARAVTICIRFSLKERQKLPTLVRLISSITDARHPLNVGLLSDIRDGMAAGVFTCPTEEAGVTFVVGTTMATISHLQNVSEIRLARPFMQQMGIMLLTGLGMSRAGAEETIGKAHSALL
ncbi:MAG: TetR family transcriptional regulator [Rhizobiales bacterium]|nr:TetR family transcriptional regulator [Hyphomicrobiales bacterium]